MEDQYEAPSIEDLGSVHELTQKTPKYSSASSDFAYPNGYSFSYQP